MWPVRLGLFEGVLYIQCMGENRNKNVLLRNSWQRVCVKLIIFLHIAGKIALNFETLPISIYVVRDPGFIQKCFNIFNV